MIFVFFKMIQDILTQTYYSNTLSQWLITLLYIFGAVLVGKLIYWISANVIKKFTSKTKTKLDDIIIDMIEEPLVFALVIFGMWIGTQQLVLTDGATNFIYNIFQVLIVINVAWLLSRLFDAIFKEYLMPLSVKSESTLDDQLLPLIKKSVNIIIWV